MMGWLIACAIEGAVFLLIVWGLYWLATHK